MDLWHLGPLVEGLYLFLIADVLPKLVFVQLMVLKAS